MHRAAGIFHPGIKGGLMNVQALEAWQKGRMNIDQAAFPARHEAFTDQTQITRQNHQIGTGFFNQVADRAVIGFAPTFKALVRYRLGPDTGTARPFKPACVKLVGKHQNDFRRIIRRLAGINDRLKVRPAARYQNGEF